MKFLILKDPPFSEHSFSKKQFSANLGYTNEVAAHWISSYFKNDKMRLPSSAEEAIAEAEIQSAWMRARYPDMVSWINESYSTNLCFWT